MLIKDYDKIVCVIIDKNVKKESDRITHLIEEKGGHVEFFVNGYGHEVNEEDYAQINHFALPSQWISTPGSYFHTRAMKTILKNALGEGVEHLLFLEDDVELTKDFDEVLNKALPDISSDWDLIYYGCNHSTHKVSTIAPHVLKLHGGYTSHCLGIRSTVFQQIIDLPEINTIDDMISQYLIPNCNAFALWPSIAIQRPGYSSIQDANVDYLDYFKIKGAEA